MADGDAVVDAKSKSEPDTVFGEREKRLARNVDIESLFLGELNERIDPGDIDGLARSIEQVGVLEPLLVRPVGDRFEVIAGGRRLRASQKVKVRAVPCIVKTMDDVSALKASFHENQERKSASPLEYGLLSWKLAQRCDSLREVADLLGKTLPWVESRINAYELYRKANVIPTDRNNTKTTGHDSPDQPTVGIVDANQIMQAVTSPPVRRHIARTDQDPEAIRTQMVRRLAEAFPKLSPSQKKRLLREFRRNPGAPIPELATRVATEPTGLKFSISFPAEISARIIDETDRTGERPEAFVRRIVIDHFSRNSAMIERDEGNPGG